MKRITTNDDIRFPIRVVKGLDSDVFTIQFYTTNKATNITKTNEDVEDGIIHLEWTELYPLGTGVMNYTVLIPEEDGSFSDDTFNKSISGTTIFYIVSNIIVPDGDDAQDLIDIVAGLDAKIDAEISRSTGKDNAHDTALADVYTKSETNTLLAGKANKNGSASETFSTNGLNLQRDGAATTLYNYIDTNGKEYVSFYDRTGGSLTYQFTANQGDNIATERQLTLKANSADVYSKTETYNRSEIEGLIDEHVPELPDNLVTDANYVHTDNNFTTTLKNKLDGIASGAEVNVQANWNETNSSSDAYIQNKPSIPTVDDEITGHSQTNPVTGGAIYAALSQYALSKVYLDASDMQEDTPPNGTIGSTFDTGDFYIYDARNEEWKSIDQTGGGEDNVQSNWNETDTTSDAYILNKPTVDSSITGSSQTNAVQGGAIYTALAGKANYVQYDTKAGMEADTSQPDGTIAFEGEHEKFYIYNDISGWRSLEDTNIQLTYIIIRRSAQTVTIKDADGNTISEEDYISLLLDTTKDVMAVYNGYAYLLTERYTEEVEDGYVQSSYVCFTSIPTGILKTLSLDLDYYDDEWSITFTPSDIGFHNTYYINSINNISQTVTYYLAGWTTRAGNLLVVNFSRDVKAGTTLNITSTGVKNIYYRGEVIKDGIISAGDTVTFAFWNNRYNVISIEKAHSTDIAAVNSSISAASTATITKTLPYYSTWKVKFDSESSYSTWTTKIVLKTVGSNTAPIHTIIIDPSILDSANYTGDIEFSNASSLRWKDNDEPDLTYQGWHGINYMVITIYEGTYAKYEKW